MASTLPSHISVKVAGTELCLLAEKALWWPERRTLLIADLHLGKAAGYRALGQPVPSGTTACNLQRLDALLQRFACQHLVFLGDFLHSAKGRTPRTLAALAEWRARHAALPITLVRGNHDRQAGDPPAGLGIEVVAEPLPLGPFALHHEPCAHPQRHVLAGHVHPAYRLRGRGRQQVRLPCFLVGEHLTLLPSFGSFTGAMTLQPGTGQRVYVIGDGGIWEVPGQLK
ncbi:MULTISPECIES: ligase-associated DNA damage response endonuclease PdeM [unclassified Pseudomonas]|uniref:ligase-associated DNA damage response endonuclease PdeM n=1 Tax=unclassified Pseudomonas TaxID=196821 RepID=UPI000C87F68B|nr:MULTISPECIES: ligase-associated DNA damage response endonuclease PdeM [unclassified Pseudomonas]PMZ88648.1 DEAD/DEAH box helicase [Pseudomonas sp. FW305-42]PNA23859.1 DEAD/DEAH box helicase [Pseudomonas sp. MPR-R1B]PNB21721.1 DEAD/DEAH box helicase [Pseudomonas sp. DP16D-E2]PNB41054.1 DEAD/DEAH box helicase [Pseudomonas sp. FW305-17]PNB56980.1 DEAD/DEAH box helicase [Pseudomonas sp. GW531-E2]